jgi:hypothetical protein
MLRRIVWGVIGSSSEQKRQYVCQQRRSPLLLQVTLVPVLAPMSAATLPVEQHRRHQAIQLH